MKYINHKSTISFAAAMMLLTISSVPVLCTTPVMAQGIAVNDRPPVGLVLLDNLMSGRSHEGDRVHFETLADVYDSQNNLLIPSGSLAIGQVTRSRGSGMFGRRGELNFTCEYVVLPDGSHIPLVGRRLGAGGTNDTAATAAVSVLVSPLGLLIKGGTVKIDQGTPIRMFIADGAVINPTPTKPADVQADFTLQNKHAPDVIGTITGFDGDSYNVATADGNRTVAQQDLASIHVQSPTVPYGQNY